MNPRLFLLSPQVVFRARVNMASVTYPLDEITFDGVTIGVDGNIFPGMSLRMGTTAGADDLGWQRVRKPASSTVIPVGRSSQGNHIGELDVEDDAFIDVLKDFRVWSKIPYIDPVTGEIFKDSDLEVELGADSMVLYPPPVANGGPGFAGTIDPDSGVVTVKFNGSHSFQFDPAVSSAISAVPSYLWFVDDGTITVGSDTSAGITATFPPGFRYVSLKVTSDDDHDHYCFIPVYARDPDDDDSIDAFQIVNRTWSNNATELAVRILADIPRITYPDGTLAMIWDDSNPPDDEVEREHMIFIGWVQAEEVGINPQRTASLRDTTLHLVDVVGRLRTLPGFAQIQYASDAPGDWTGTLYPNLLYYAWYLLYWHSTAIEVADFLLGTQTLNNYAFILLGSDAGNLYDQVNDMAGKATPDHYLTSHWRLGQLKLAVDQNLQFVDDRDATIVQILTDEDWIAISFPYARPPRVQQLISHAVVSTDEYVIVEGEPTIPTVHCIAPGPTPGQGEGLLESSERIAFGQFDLNTCEGNRYARLNAPYGRVQIAIPLSRLEPDFDPADLGWVQLVVTGNNQPQRGMPFNDRGIVHELSVTYSYEHGGITATATLGFEYETYGPRAVTLVLEEA